MDALIGFLNNPIVLTGAQLIFGLLIKRLPQLEGLPNKLIPLFNGLLALLVNLAGPADANAAGLGDGLKGVGGYLLNAVVEAAGQTLVTTGIHSAAKNFWQQLILAAVSPKRK